MRSSSLLLLLIAVCANGSRTFLPRLPVLETSTPGTANCTLKWHAQYIDHFSQSQGSKKYQQRYFVYDTAWKKDGPIFFYVGNESPVDLYVNATGLMWENAEEFGALLVFAEHRYWGLSQPLNGTDKSYLTPEQAMEDYATLVYDLKDELNAQSSPVIAFGGSYGGDLAAWSRMKYPATFEGAIAASAPVLGFLGEYPAWNSNLYFQVITRNAGVPGGSPASCATNIRKAISLLDTFSDHALLQKTFRLCAPPATAFEVQMLKYWIRDAFDEMSMGNYPYASTYISGAPYALPAYPIRRACDSLQTDITDPTALFTGVAKAAGLLYNVSKKEKCFALPSYPTPSTPGAPMDGLWDYVWCTTMVTDSFWFSTTGTTDMFWKNPFNWTLVQDHCKAAWGVEPRRNKLSVQYGGRGLGRGHSNIVFSNGAFDPWGAGGVNYTMSDSITSVWIPNGAHHIDLMFSHPDDTADIKAARVLELAQIRKWISAYREEQARATSRKHEEH